MMHYLLAAGILISGAVVVYTAYSAYTLYAEGPYYHEYSFPGEGPKDERFRNNDLPRSHHDIEDENEEKSNNLRRRKKKSTNSYSQRSVSSQVHSEDEEALLDKLSYLNAVEQEIERKKQQLADEERILSEKEREIEQRKQNLLSSSHSSLSLHSLDSPLDNNFLNKNNSLNTTSTTVNSIKVHESPLVSQQQNYSPPNDPDYLNLQPPIVAATSVNITAPSVNTVVSSLHDEQLPDHEEQCENVVFSDVAAHAILAQDLSHISHSQKEAFNNYSPVVTRPPVRSVTTNSTISSSTKSQSMSMIHPNQSRFVTTKSVRSEDTWSEIESVISENVGSSILSSAVDIDMEDVDVIEH